MRRVLLGVAVAVVAVIAATVYVGARVREDTVVPDPYQEGAKLNRAPGAVPAADHGDVHAVASAEPALTLTLSPRPLRTMRELEVEVRRGGTAGDVSVSFAMAGMDMGDNTVRLSPAGEGRYRGKAVLVRCPGGRKDWVATVRVRGPAGTVDRQVPFQVEE